ncbi:MAG: hypothetical protein ACTSQI_02935 [Candidatus Helarchaeota archaeon]
MSRFNQYLWGFICCLPMGLILLFIGIAIRQGGATYSSTSLIILGIISLAIAGILLIAGLIKLGQQTV